jgi:hypothetical protein
MCSINLLTKLREPLNIYQFVTKDMDEEMHGVKYGRKV